MSDEEYLEPEEEQEIAGDYTDTFSTYPKPRAKNTIVEFLNKVFRTRDSTKVSFMEEEEIRANRAAKLGALWSSIMYGENSKLKEYFLGKSEIIAAPTLSRQGFLVNAAITTKKEFQAKLKSQKKNKGWFKPKGERQI
jgi:hypothetical protein